MEARQKVEHVSLAKLKEWRDETGEQTDEIEETFREIIVLDDDDDQSSDERSPSMPNDRESSMEIVSSRATARDLQPDRYASGRVVKHGSRRTIFLQPYDAQRPVPISDSPQQRIVHQPRAARPYPSGSDHAHSARNGMYNVPHSSPAYSHAEGSSHYIRPATFNPYQARPRPPPPPSRNIMQEIDGRLYHVSGIVMIPARSSVKSWSSTAMPTD